MTWALRATSNSSVAGDDNTPTFTLPTHQSGDLLIAVVAVPAQNAAYGITGVASGWTDLYSPADGGYDYVGVYAKVATSASETPPTFTIGQSNVVAASISAWTGGPSSLSGYSPHANSVASDAATTHPYLTPALTVTENNTLVLYATSVTNDVWTTSGSTKPNSATAICELNVDGTYTDMALLVAYAIQTTAANVGASSWQDGGTPDNLRYRSLAVSLVGAPGAKYLKLLAHSSAASATGVEGVVLNATRDTVVGEFTGRAFEASLESGEAVLLIPVADITPDGSTLTTSDTPLVAAYNSTDGTVGLGSATVIEV